MDLLEAYNINPDELKKPTPKKTSNVGTSYAAYGAAQRRAIEGRDSGANVAKPSGVALDAAAQGSAIRNDALVLGDLIQKLVPQIPGVAIHPAPTVVDNYTAMGNRYRQQSEARSKSRQFPMPNVATSNVVTDSSSRAQSIRSDLESRRKASDGGVDLLAAHGIAPPGGSTTDQLKKIPSHLADSLSAGVTNTRHGMMYADNDPDQRRVLESMWSIGKRAGYKQTPAQIEQRFLDDEKIRKNNRDYYGHQIARTNEKLDKTSPYFGGGVLDDVYSGIQSVVQQAPGLVASVALKSPAPMLSQIGLQTYFPEYAMSREAGLSRDDAMLAAGGKGAFELGTEFMPAMKGIQYLKGKGKFLNALTDQVRHEVPGEMIAEAGQSGIDQHYGMNGRTAGDWQQYVDLLPDNLKSAAVAAMAGAGAQSGVYHAGRKLLGPTAAPPSSDAPQQSGIIQRVQQIMRPATEHKTQQSSDPLLPAQDDPLIAAAREVADRVYSEPEPMTGDQIKQQLSNSSDILPSLIESGKIVVHETPDTLPAQPENGAIPQGYTDENGTIHLVANQLTPENINKVALHEAFHGGKSLVGDAGWRKLMSNLSVIHDRAKKLGSSNSPFWRNAMRSVEGANVNKSLTPEEFGAYALEHYDEAPAGVKRWIDNTVGGMQAWALQRFGAQVGNATPAQLRALAQKALQQNTPVESGKFSIKQEMPNFIQPETKLQYQDRQHFDRMNRVENIEKQAKELGYKLPEWLSAYSAEVAYHGRKSERLSDFEKKEQRALAETMAKNQVTPERLDWYLLARHAEERNKHISSINPEMQDGGSGMTTQQASDLLSGKSITTSIELADQHGRVYREQVDVPGFSENEIARLNEVSSQIDNILGGTRDMLKDYGLESEASIKDWSDQYKHYVPLSGKAGIPEYGGSPGKQSGFSVRGGQKQALGRKSIAPNITEQVLRQRQDAIARGETNRVASHVITFARELEKQGMPEAPNGKPLFEINPTDIRKYLKDGKLIVADMPTTIAENIVTARVDGRDVPVRVNDPAYAEAIRNLNASQLDGAMKWINSATRKLSMAYTGANPQFLAKAYGRDLITVGALGQRYGFDIIKGSAKQQVPALLESIRYEFGGKESESFRQFRLLGGRTGFFNIERDLERKRSSLESIIKETGPISRTTAIPKVRKLTRAMWDYYLALGSSLESAVRYATFKLAIKNGKTPEQAARVAKEITINFNRKGAGKTAQNMNAMFAFYNASLQGARTTAIALQNKNVRRAAYIYTALRWGSILGLLAMLPDDENREELLSNPEFRKQAIEGLLIPTQDEKRPYLPIPFGPDVAFTGGAALALADLFYNPNNKGARRASEAMAQSIARAFSPPPVSDVTEAVVNADPSNKGRAALTAVMPTVIKPGMQAATGLDYLGRDIVPGNKFTKADPDAYKARTRNKTSWLSDFAIWLNETTGGNVARSGKIDVSPESIDTLLRGYGGGIYSTIRDSVEVSTNPQKDWLDAPIIRQFVANPDALERGKASRAREIIDKYDAMRAEIIKLHQHGEHAEADKLQKTYNNSGASITNNAKKELSALYKQEQILTLRTDENSRSELQRIKDRRREISTTLNKLFPDE